MDEYTIKVRLVKLHELDIDLTLGKIYKATEPHEGMRGLHVIDDEGDENYITEDQYEIVEDGTE